MPLETSWPITASTMPSGDGATRHFTRNIVRLINDLGNRCKWDPIPQPKKMPISADLRGSAAPFSTTCVYSWWRLNISTYFRTYQPLLTKNPSISKIWSFNSNFECLTWMSLVKPNNMWTTRMEPVPAPTRVAIPSGSLWNNKGRTPHERQTETQSGCEPHVARWLLP